MAVDIAPKIGSILCHTIEPKVNGYKSIVSQRFYGIRDIIAIYIELFLRFLTSFNYAI